jgi:hypothetical protein
MAESGCSVNLAEFSLNGAGPVEQFEPLLGDVPEYPAGALPAAARQLVEYGVTGGTPAALLGGAVLAALAAAVGPAAEIEVRASWHERPILWLPLLASRGAGKSPSQGIALGPLRDHDRQLTDQERGRRVLLGDMTLEALARSLNASSGGAALDADELAVLLRGLGEYKRSSGDRGRFLQLWTGAPWSFIRVGASGKAENAIDFRIHRPTLVIVGGLQPQLHELLGGEEDGMRPRRLPHLAQMPNVETAREQGDMPAGWGDLLRELLGMRGRERTWQLAPDARAAFEGHRRHWKRQARGLETASTAAALVKADVHLARVALVVAEAEAPGAGTVIAAEVIERAAAIVGYSLDCWRALPEQGGLALSHRDERLDRAIARLIAWLEEHGGSASRRDLQQARVAGARTAADLEALLQRYQASYPGAVTEVVPDHGGLPTITVNAPPRRRSSYGVDSVNTEVSSGQKAYEHGQSDAVDTVNSADVNTESGNTAPEAPGAARTCAETSESLHCETPADTKDPASAAGDTDLTDEQLLELFPGSTLEHVSSASGCTPWTPCEPGGPMATATFRGGPLDGQRHKVPEHGPAIVRVHGPTAIEFYVHRKGTVRTYEYAGQAPR